MLGLPAIERELARLRNLLMEALGQNVPAPSEIVVRLDFTYLTPTPAAIYALLANDLVESVKVVITTAFSDPAATIEVGTTATPGLVLAPGEVGLGAGTVGDTFSNESLFVIAAPTTLQLTIAPGASVAGAGTLLAKIKR
jgi:hypothetical protein